MKANPQNSVLLYSMRRKQWLVSLSYHCTDSHLERLIYGENPARGSKPLQGSHFHFLLTHKQVHLFTGSLLHFKIWSQAGTRPNHH